jgi:hypothetical protein
LVKRIDLDSTDSWLQRARGAGTPDVVVGAATNSAAKRIAVATHEGWDPWEAWLRHIDQPRRHLGAERSKSPD